VSITRNPQKNWISHTLRENSLKKIALKSRMEGKKTAGRPRILLLDWMFDKKSKWKYENVKELMQDRDAWRRWIPDLLDGRELEEEKKER